jgi:hypothetical protein
MTYIPERNHQLCDRLHRCEHSYWECVLWRRVAASAASSLAVKQVQSQFTESAFSVAASAIRTVLGRRSVFYQTTSDPGLLSPAP